MADTSRVTMIWPSELKERVRGIAGARGLTDWTLDAVRARLESQPDLDARLLIQRMADAIATGGDYEDRAQTLRWLDLPDWVDRTGWPDYEAGFDKRVLVEAPAPVKPEPEVAAESRPGIQSLEPNEVPWRLEVTGEPESEAEPPTTPLHQREDWHIGRSWAGTPLEDACPCPQEACGLVSQARVAPECPEHAPGAMKTMRAGHLPEDCPGARAEGAVAEAAEVEREDELDDAALRSLGICPTCNSPLIAGECWTCAP